MRLTDRPEFKAFVKLFDRPFRGITGPQLFREWLRYFWSYIDAGVSGSPFVDLHHSLTQEEVLIISNLNFGYLEIAKVSGFEDVLGPVYQILDGTDRGRGQCFTPMEVARLTARLSIGDHEKSMYEKSRVDLNDPACGSGVLGLAFAETVQRLHGDDILRKVTFWGQDIDPACVLMTSIQYRMTGIDSYAKAVREGGYDYDTPVDRYIVWTIFATVAHYQHVIDAHGANPEDFGPLKSLFRARLEEHPTKKLPQNRAERRRLQRSLQQQALAHHQQFSLETPEAALPPEAFLANPTSGTRPALPASPWALALPSR